MRPGIPWLFISELVVGVPLAVYTWKSLVLVLFQRKVIYMPYIPIDARRTPLSAYAKLLDGLDAEQVEVKNGRVALQGILLTRSNDKKPDVVIVHLQGNAGAPPHRIPLFTSLFRSARTRSFSLAILAVAPRSYWLSTRARLTEASILSDHRSTLAYARARFPSSTLILHGHSLGGAAAAQLGSTESERLDGVILEAAFTSMPQLIPCVYPQRWLPYRYLAPLAFDRWDSLRAMREWPAGRSVLVVQSERDELVPNWMGERLFEEAKAKDKTIVNIAGATHQNAFSRRGWSEAMLGFVQRVHDGRQEGAKKVEVTEEAEVISRKEGV